MYRCYLHKCHIPLHQLPILSLFPILHLIIPTVLKDPLHIIILNLFLHTILLTIIPLIQCTHSMILHPFISLTIILSLTLYRHLYLIFLCLPRPSSPPHYPHMPISFMMSRMHQQSTDKELC